MFLSLPFTGCRIIVPLALASAPWWVRLIQGPVAEWTVPTSGWELGLISLVCRAISKAVL